MKKKIITGAVLAVIFVIALIGFSGILNQGTADTTTDMGGATLPILSFKEGDYTINELPGYTESMDVTSMRDMLLPLSVGTTVQANISGYSGKIQSAEYEVCGLNGKPILKEEIKNVNDILNMELGDSISDGGEKVLKIKLNLDGKKSVYYYTRVVRAAEFNVQQCLEFAEEFHNKTFDEDEVLTLKPYLIRSKSKNGNSLQTVTLYSGIDQLGWGSLEPKIVGDVRWQIKESNETYTSVYLKYQVKSKETLYNVTEFLKVRFLKGKASIEDYNRTMNQVFTGSEKAFNEDGILLGIADENVPYLVNKSGNVVAFVQEREVWNYNKEKDEISLVFSFADAENNDARNHNDNHSIKLVDIDKAGNTTFAVYGYMNRGEHEGQVGAAIYYFDIEKGCVEEKAFIPSMKSGEIAKIELEQLVYYSKSQNMLYVMFDGSMYQVNLENQEKTVLVKNLEENQYVTSEDGKHLAYQANGSLTEATSMQVWNLKSGKNFEVKAEKDEIIRPLGFVMGDVIYGVGKKADIGKTVSGETVIPLYKLEIRNDKNKVAKTYEVNQAYILDVQIENNMVTLNRVQKSGGTYTNITPDYITNNKDQEKQTMQVETFVSEDTGKMVRLTDTKGLGETEPKLLKPKQVLYEKPTTIAFELGENAEAYYVYGHGKLQGIYDKAGEAIVAADPVRGVVTTSKQTKVWERGNRMLRYSKDDTSAFVAKGGESSLEASLRQLLAYEGKNVDVAKEMAAGKSALQILNDYSGGEAVDLSGCTIEQLCYIIGKGTPVVAMTGSDSAILLVGYSDTTITYLNPQTGRKPTESLEAIERMAKGSQGTFIGYVK